MEKDRNIEMKQIKALDNVYGMAATIFFMLTTGLPEPPLTDRAEEYPT